jgi:SAM-dependent methyltransferase
MNLDELELKGSREKIFTDIYINQGWGGGETISGDGSTIENTIGIRDQLLKFFEYYSVRSIVDAPCGDYNWFGQSNIMLDNYIGLDIVEDLINKNSSTYGDENHKFYCKDICTDDIPRVDLILCRDCLMHLSNRESLQAIRNFKRSGSKYLLITTNPNNPTNTNIQTGTFRHLNMTKQPFNFSAPISLVNERDTRFGGMYSDKSLGLWLLEDIIV